MIAVLMNSHVEKRSVMTRLEAVDDTKKTLRLEATATYK